MKEKNIKQEDFVVKNVWVNIINKMSVSKGRGKDWNVKREVARERDSYTCTRCGVLEENHKSYQLSVHHIVPFKFFKDTEKANEPTNLLTLCEVCHRKIHTGENHPSKFKNTFSEVIG